MRFCQSSKRSVVTVGRTRVLRLNNRRDRRQLREEGLRQVGEVMLKTALTNKEKQIQNKQEVYHLVMEIAEFLYTVGTCSRISVRVWSLCYGWNYHYQKRHYTLYATRMKEQEDKNEGKNDTAEKEEMRSGVKGKGRQK